jgi:hypothetical protein
MSSRYMTTEQREMKNCKKHTCARCGAVFTCKTKCWAHMDNDCPKKGAPPEQWFSAQVITGTKFKT